MRSIVLSVIFALLAIGAGLLLQELHSEQTLRFQGFENAHWVGAESCEPVKGETIDFTFADFLLARPSPTGTTCTSSWIPVQGNVVVAQYSALFFGVESHSMLSIDLIGSDGVSLGTQTIPPYSFDQKWRTLSWHIPVPNISTVQLVVRNRIPARSKLRVRSRIDFFQVSNTRMHLQKSLSTTLLLPSLILCSLVLVFLFSQYYWKPAPRLAALCFLFLTACAVHFRRDVYFHFDEWFFLGRLFEGGLSSLFVSHNEHVIPVFSLLYLLEYKLFGQQYGGWTLVSIALHCSNALLISKLVQNLNRALPQRVLIGRTLAFLYLISFLHSAAIQWALCQSSLLAVAFFLLAANLSFEYLRQGTRSKLYLFATTWFLSMLSFGVVFSGIVLLPLLAVLYCRKNGGVQAQLGSLSQYSAALLSPLLLTGLLYYLFRDGSGLSLEERPAFELSKLSDYVIAGSQFGTIARGTGLLPFPDFLALTQVKSLLAFGQQTNAWFAVGVGLLANMFFLLYALLHRERKDSLLCWAIAQAFICIPFLLIGVGRLRWGPEHAISLRYQALPSIGLVLLVLPLVRDCIVSLSERPTRLKIGSAVSVLILYVFTQLYGGWRFQHFRHSGYLMNTFVSQLEDWAQVLAAHNFDPGSEKAYRAPGSTSAGMHPVSFYGAPDPKLRPPELHPATMIELLSLWDLARTAPRPVVAVENPF